MQETCVELSEREGTTRDESAERMQTESVQQGGDAEAARLRVWSSSMVSYLREPTKGVNGYA